ncbi:hypothetical protein B879_04155 [Cecembia lonarensis LW9]|uniref:Uncharacterized protein n=1 Tax=Cecembia lonarensis (strain CCUG 58316 / KCTC 22772 / LW9) TaxID=1225176 RepID=K1LT32_CECL9|nr:hypothetical protein B879_04155 [Cecembia lonarensis LW9]
MVTLPVLVTVMVYTITSPAAFTVLTSAVLFMLRLGNLSNNCVSESVAVTSPLY